MVSSAIIEGGNSESPELLGMVERVKSVIEAAKLDDKPATLAVVGIESLHLIRDLYGSRLTDEILRRVASLFEKAERKDHVLGWIESSHIIVLLPNCDVERAMLISDRVIQCVRELHLTAGKQRLHLAPNIGLAHTQHAGDFFFETMLQVATEGAEVASSGGGGRAVHTELYEIVQPDAPQRKKRAKSEQVEAVVAQPSAPAVMPVSPRSSEPAALPTQSDVAPSPDSTAAELERLDELVNAQVEVTRKEDIRAKLNAGRVHDQMLEDMLRDLFAESQSSGASAKELEAKIVAAVNRWSEESRATLVLELYTQQEKDLNLLRRRLAKTMRRMEMAENEADILRSGESAAEGIESSFRSVQGLSARDAQFKLKSGMMYDIMRANLELMRRIH